MSGSYHRLRSDHPRVMLQKLRARVLARSLTPVLPAGAELIETSRFTAAYTALACPNYIFGAGGNRPRHQRRSQTSPKLQLSASPRHAMVTLMSELRADRVVATLEQLRDRIVARFPKASLVQVCAELIDTAALSAREAARLSRPSYSWRLGGLVLLGAGILAQIAAFRFLRIESTTLSAPELVQGLEAAVNLLILFGGAIWFLLTLEERSKRRIALGALHRLRSLAHVIDMHQLTKDPTVLLDSHKTAASPERTMTQFELTRYLDYCSEMLALIGKLAALYAEGTRDGIVIEAVNDIENLTNGLGRKIWQKITIIGVLEERGA